jgi:hypothetical protein
LQELRRNQREIKDASCLMVEMIGLTEPSEDINEVIISSMPNGARRRRGGYDSIHLFGHRRQPVEDWKN